MSQTIKWEYLCETFPNVGPYFDNMIQRMNFLGQSGWEVFHMSEYKDMCSSPSEKHFKVYFKRLAKD